MKDRTTCLALLAVFAVAAAAPAVAESPMADFLWENDTSHRGTITLSWAEASDSAGPSTRGPRIAYGDLGGRANDYPWVEFWGTFREDGDFEITAAGLSVAHVAKLHRRFGVGPLLDLGLSKRRKDGRSAVAGMVGSGAEGVVRLFRHGDLVVTTQAVYRTTSDVELQARLGIRIHHRRLPSLR